MIQLVDGRYFRRTRWAINLDRSQTHHAVPETLLRRAESENISVSVSAAQFGRIVFPQLYITPVERRRRHPVQPRVRPRGEEVPNTQPAETRNTGGEFARFRNSPCFVLYLSLCMCQLVFVYTLCSVLV